MQRFLYNYLIIMVLLGLLLISAVLSGAISDYDTLSQASVVSHLSVAHSADFSLVKTKGGHSYIPLKLSGEPHDHVDVVLDVLNRFEEAHPEWEVTGWQLQKHFFSSGGRTLVGLWIDHRAKE